MANEGEDGGLLLAGDALIRKGPSMEMLVTCSSFASPFLEAVYRSNIEKEGDTPSSLQPLHRSSLEQLPEISPVQHSPQRSSLPRQRLDILFLHQLPDPSRLLVRLSIGSPPACEIPPVVDPSVGHDEAAVRRRRGREGWKEGGAVVHEDESGGDIFSVDWMGVKREQSVQARD
jgi:hypothetical protein